MNAASALILGLVLALAALAVWRAWRKGAPCECGGNRKACGDSCCCCGEKTRPSPPLVPRVTHVPPDRRQQGLRS